ncbi:MAG: Uma2 family endonuclease, partial [Planctomycetota bacterium]
EEYHRLGEQGFFDGRRVELINGEILEVSPQSHDHFWSIEGLRELLAEVFPRSGFWIRTQGPVEANEASEPEPDLAVIRGSFREATRHPSTALLAIEVAKTSQAIDKNTKADLYASAKIEDYWVLDLDRRELTVFRKPVQEAASPSGWRYTLTEVIAESGTVKPLAAGEATLKIADMLPPVEPPAP